MGEQDKLSCLFQNAWLSEIDHPLTPATHRMRRVESSPGMLFHSPHGPRSYIHCGGSARAKTPDAECLSRPVSPLQRTSSAGSGFNPDSSRERRACSLAVCSRSPVSFGAERDALFGEALQQPHTHSATEQPRSPTAIEQRLRSIWYSPTGWGRPTTTARHADSALDSAFGFPLTWRSAAGSAAVLASMSTVAAAVSAASATSGEASASVRSDPESCSSTSHSPRPGGASPMTETANLVSRKLNVVLNKGDDCALPVTRPPRIAVAEGLMQAIGEARAKRIKHGQATLS